MDADVVHRAAVFPRFEIPLGPLRVAEGMQSEKGYRVHFADAAVPNHLTQRDVGAEIRQIQHAPDRAVLAVRQFLDAVEFGQAGAQRLVAQNVLSRFQGGNQTLPPDGKVVAAGNHVALRRFQHFLIGPVSDVDALFHCRGPGFRIFLARGGNRSVTPFLQQTIQGHNMAVTKPDKGNLQHHTSKHSMEISFRSYRRAPR